MEAHRTRSAISAPHELQRLPNPLLEFEPNQVAGQTRLTHRFTMCPWPKGTFNFSPRGANLFEAEDGRVFQVHLTLSRRPEQPPLPRTRVYANAAEWIQQVMLPANEEYRG